VRRFAQNHRLQYLNSNMSQPLVDAETQTNDRRHQAGADLLQSTWEAIGWETTDDERERFNLKRLGGYQV
jgi:hypothetical protein